MNNRYLVFNCPDCGKMFDGIECKNCGYKSTSEGKMKLLRAKNRDWIQLEYTLLNDTYHCFWIDGNGKI